jgi:hypothetical protein
VTQCVMDFEKAVWLALEDVFVIFVVLIEWWCGVNLMWVEKTRFNKCIPK